MPKLHSQIALDPARPWLTCPVCNDKAKITSLSKDMVRLLRKLRRDMRACNTCTVDKDACPILIDLNSQILIAINSVQEAWDLNDG
jgi:hypothetical protein